MIINSIMESIVKYPSRVAIIDNAPYTYQELDLHSNKISNYLLKYNVQHESKVVFLMRRSFDMLATILAIWKRGGTYIPLDLKTPPQRIKRILDNIEPACIVCDSSLLSHISGEGDIPVLTLKDTEFINCDNYCNISEQAQLAYMIYTSGSTGEPKGVMITQDNLVNHVSWLIDDYGFSSTDCFSFNSSMAFDFSVACTLLPLSVGAKIIITSEIDTLDIATYCRQLEENKVTFAKWTPSYFRLLIDYVEHSRPNLLFFRYIMVAGEELLTSYAEKWFNIYPSHRLINEYGPTEATVGITTYLVTKETLNKELHTVPIGKPAINSTLYLADLQNNLIKDNEIGELLIKGASVALGYYKQPKLTAERFIDNPFDNKSEKLYRTGDLVKKLPCGNYLYVGRIDNQVKVNGFRIELSEIEHYILQYNNIRHAKITIEKEDQETSKINAYLVLRENTSIHLENLRKALSQQLPNFMIPSQFFFVSHIPVNKNGKVDYKALKEIAGIDTTFQKELFVPSTAADYIVEFIKKHVGIKNKPDFNVPFFSLGLNSLLISQLVSDINQKYKCRLKIQDLFSYPTISTLTAYINKENEIQKASTNNLKRKNLALEPIAIIAMDCRLPGASNCEAFWELCQTGKESIEFFPPKENEQLHSSPSEKAVYARGILKDIEYFDANFFGFSAKDAHLSDPQHRLLIESAWVAFEKAGYIPELDDYKIGIYVSMNDSTYLLNHNLIERLEPFFSDRFALQRLMSPQCLATKIAYSLNCTGPSITIQTACSGSLVAVVLACQQLAAYHCDIALAGGISIITPQERPYIYQRGNIFSPTGHCRPFDAKAEGTVFSNGLGTVVLKRLEDALRDNDTIISVIKGASSNNDGCDKMSYTAPSVQGQMSCILSAQESAGIEANSIQYIEAHGTGTLIGDPIEIEALSKAFRKTSKQQQFCALGSLKANIGHTHVAAGIAGLIKTSLAISNCQIPPSINFEIPNPNIDWENSPFYVNKRLQHWAKNGTPRRAAVSAFGVGGTNAHVILEEAPPLAQTSPTKRSCILVLSAKSKNALQVAHDNLIAFFKKNNADDEQDGLLADVAYTLQLGRKKFDYKTGIVCNNIKEAIIGLEENRNSTFFHSSNNSIDKPRIVFLFPGQGTQYVNLSQILYKKEPVYQQYLDSCLKIASSHLKRDLKPVLFPVTETDIKASEQIHQTEFTHPILFAVEYSLAKLLLSWGIRPDYMFGHSLGEYVAACLSGVFSLEDAIKIICARGKAIANCGEGAMLIAPLAEKEASLYCNSEIYLAAINSDELCVFSGKKIAIDKLYQQLTKIKADMAPMFRKLNCFYPFHSKLLTPAVESFSASLRAINRQRPTIPYLSNLTGNWVSESDIEQDSYWIDHMLNPVQLSRCAKQLSQYPDSIFIEVGPGQTLSSLISQQATHSIKTIGLLPSNKQQKDNLAHHLIENALKMLWSYDYPINWGAYYKNEERRRVPIPTYPFEKSRYWFDEIINDKDNKQITSDIPSFYIPTWIREPTPLTNEATVPSNNQKIKWIIFADDSEICTYTISRLKAQCNSVWIIERGKNYTQNNSNQFLIDQKNLIHYEKVIQEVVKNDINDYVIIYFWSMNQSNKMGKKLLDNDSLYNSLYSVLSLIKAFYNKNKNAIISCVMVTNQLQTVMGTERTIPLVSSVLSLCRVLSLENQNYRFNSIDIEYKLNGSLVRLYAQNILDTALTYLQKNTVEEPYIAAYRHQYCWRPSYQPIHIPEKIIETDIVIKPNSFYFITGGLGAMGLTIAEWISSKAPVTLLLLSRRPFPARHEWKSWVEHYGEHDKTSQIIKKLNNILTKGSEIVVAAGDIADYKQIKLVIKKMRREYGGINGIFHLAGLPGEGVAILKNVAGIQSVLSPKIQGILVLSKLFKNKSLDFLVCASSLTAIVGGIGQLDYCAANLFLDYFVSQKQFKNCKRLLTINWNSWSSIGMATNLEKSKAHEKLYLENSVSPEEAMHLLENAFKLMQNQIIISRIKPKAERKRIISAFDNVGKEEKAPPLATQSNTTSTYETIRRIWQDILGVNTINQQETFYSLGGDSLSAIQLLTKLDKQFNVDISLQELAHASTLESLTKLIEAKPIRTSDLIVPLSSNGDDSVDNNLIVYFIHPLGGTVFYCLSLVPYLTNKGNYYAIQDPELAKGETLFYSIKDMAQYYVNEIRSHQNKGKIILIGASFGGNIAIEMASLLEAASYFVQKVILIDSWANLGDIMSLKKENPESTDSLETLKVMRDYYGTESHQYQSINKRLLWLRSYTPSMVSVDVVLLAAEDILPLYKTNPCKNNGWASYCSKSILQYKIKGSHDTMFQANNLPELGKLLNTLL